MKPVAEIMFIDFITLAMDQITNQAAKMKYMFGGKVKLPIVIQIQSGVGSGSAAQHSQSLEAWVNHIPGLKIVMPSNPYDAKGLLKSSIRDDNPVVFIENKMLYSKKGFVPNEEYIIPLGKAKIKKEGQDLTVITYSRMVDIVMSLADKLEIEGINIEVIDLRCIFPLDEQMIYKLVKKTGKIIIVHDTCERNGVGAEIVAKIACSDTFYYLDCKIRRVCGLNVSIPYNENLEKKVLSSEERILKVIKEMI